MKLKKVSIMLILMLMSFKVGAQIYVQTVAHWNVNDQYDFSGSYLNYNIEDQDTTILLNMSYDVHTLIKEATDSTYTVRWLYHNHKFINGTEIAKKLSFGKDSVQVIFTTDELGSFKEIQNMQELLNFYNENFDYLQKLYSNEKQILLTLESLKKQYSDSDYIKSNSIKDLINFYTFHGGMYQLNEEYEGSLKTGNNINPEKPFDTKTNVWLDEIDSENNTYVLRSYQAVDEDQLKNAVIKLLNVPLDSIPEVKNETYIANRIHGSGWTTYMIWTREVTSLDSKSVEEYVIQMK